MRHLLTHIRRCYSQELLHYFNGRVHVYKLFIHVAANKYANQHSWTISQLNNYAFVLLAKLLVYLIKTPVLNRSTAHGSVELTWLGGGYVRFVPQLKVPAETKTHFLYWCL